MRLFLAVDAQNILVSNDSLKKLKVGLKNKNIEHQFVHSNQWHIPLVQLGDISREDYSERESYIHNVIQGHSVFDLKLSGIWAYPNQNEGRLLWIGVQNSKELRALYEELSHQIPSMCELDFKPNLPLVRLRNHKNVVDLISPYKGKDFGKLKVDSVTLYEMTSGGAFPVLKALQTYYLMNDNTKTQETPLLSLGD